MSVRFRFRRHDLDLFGVLSPEALRRMASALWDVPTEVSVVIDLGPCLQVQRQLIRDLALYRCGPRVRFVGPDWRSVRGHTDALSVSLAVMTQ